MSVVQTIRIAAAFVLALAGLLSAQPPGRRGGPLPPEAPPVKPEERCMVEGQVLNQASGEPVARANLILRRVDGRGDAPSSTSSDASGKFTMKDLEPGRYRLFVSRNGFVQQEYGARQPGRQGTTLALEKSQKIGGLVFKLIPHGVVSGRVTDEEGEPMSRVAMGVLRSGYMNGRRRLVQAGFAETNDLGEYRIFGLAPGKYYLSATYRGGMMMMGTVDRSAGASEESFVPVYYPGVMDTSAAQLLEVTAGGQLRGMDLTLRRTPTVRVRGRVANVSGANARRGVQLFLVARGQVGMMFPNTFGRTLDAQGNFEIRGVAPGSYILAADYYEEGKRLSARLPVEVGGSHVENLILTLAPGVELKGRLRAEGQSEADLKEVQVMLEVQEALPMGGGNASHVKEDGSLTISGLSPDKYSLRVNGLPPGFYLKSARLGDSDALANGVDLSQGAGGALEIVVSSAGAKVEGLVVDDNQQPAPGLTVVLAPEESKRAQAHLFQNVTTDQTGRYSFKSVAPGDYVLLAFEEMEPGAERDPETVKQFERSAEKISLKENGSETKQLKLIPAAAAN
jgi:5-hydroxyisourate hydrolase-like protein (transthyretin family)